MSFHTSWGKLDNTQGENNSSAFSRIAAKMPAAAQIETGHQTVFQAPETRARFIRHELTDHE
jgi:hypothetical protein